MQKDFYLPIMGEDYSVSIVPEEQFPERFPKEILGACDLFTKEIVVTDLHEENKTNRVLRHEIVHAMFEESGLGDECTFVSEEIVDWIARQAPKMFRIFCRAKAFSEHDIQSFNKEYQIGNKLVG